MYTLYIDTHFVNLVLAIFKDDKLIKEKKLDSNKHSEHTIPMLKELLVECNLGLNDLNDIIVISGPGSFTGVRIGIVVAKILAYTLKINVKALSYLEAMALEFDTDVVVGIKDRNGAFIGEFDSNHNLLKDYYYLKTEELKISSLNIKYEVDIDLEKVKKYANHLDSIQPHSLVPLYVKKIEVDHD